MPINRADYYVSMPGELPSRCAAGTGLLYKATVNHADGGLTELPLLDCVADMQVVFITDVDGDGNLEWNNADWPFTVGPIDPLNPNPAQLIRAQLRDVRIYILAHEGQRDTSFTFTNFSAGCAVANCLRVGDVDS